MQRPDAAPEGAPPRVDDRPEWDDVLQRVAGRRCTVLIQGETGAGKEVTARRIHALSPRADGPFIAVDCTGLREELMESQLFGHDRGAFTGADKATIGFIRAADRGTLFLDEIGELSLGLQAKLLRTIQERAVVPLGGVRPIPVDIRIVCATHRDLASMVASGAFREDLYFRLDVVRLTVQPLRARQAEIPELVRSFLLELADEYEEPEASITPEALAVLARHDWPGNVRELRNAVEHAFVFADGARIDVAHLPMRLTAAGSVAPASDSPVPTLEDAERALIAEAIERAAGNKSKAASWLRIDRRRLHRKMLAYGMA